MNFSTPEFLTDHAKSILAFYDDKVVDPSGGYFQNFNDDGTLFDMGFKQLVSSTRIIVNYARAGRHFDNPEYLTIAKHGLDYLELCHFDASNQTYAWTLNNHKVQDSTQQAYGYAFVLLAYAHAYQAGIISTSEKIHQTFGLLEKRFYLPELQIYGDELNPDGTLNDYRGQNANMHICEALIACFKATNEPKYIERALQLAKMFCNTQAAKTEGLIWEHFKTDLNPDWQYNIDDPKNLYRPWGFQPGHQTEWAKLLLQLNQLQPQVWLVDKAKTLFNKAYRYAWDNENGGLVYGFNKQGKWCDDDKYFWVQAESIAAASLLLSTSKDKWYQHCYKQLWQYCWQHMIDHQHGAWFRVLTVDNNKYSEQKSAAGAKCDYHTLGMCFDILESL